MRLRPAAVIVAAFVAGLAVLPAAAAPRQQPRETLQAEVGPGFTIRLLHADGRVVSQLVAGEYAIVVQDRSAEHNFHLTGAGVDRTTSVEIIETVTWNVTVSDAQRYRFQCDAHPTLQGTFDVGNVPQPPPPPPVRRLNASVSARAIAVRTTSGSKARVAAVGRYRITVRDTATTENFHLIGPGLNRKTPVARKATATWAVTLRRGKYSYRSDRTRRLTGSFTAR